MIDNLFKSNFIGKDGFRWWIGQVAPKNVQEDQMDQVGKSWGARVKVRILGYHPLDEGELPNEDLPWAQVLLSPQGGSGGGGIFKSMRIRPGDVVLGFFLDGDDAQLPVILGLFARTGARYGGSGKYKSPFEPFSGYTDHVKPGDILIKNEDGGASGKKSIKIPRILPKELTNKLNEAIGGASGLENQLNQINNFIKSPEAQDGINQAFSNLNSSMTEGVNKLNEKAPELLNKLEDSLSSLDVTMNESVGLIAAFAGTNPQEKMKTIAENMSKELQSAGKKVDTKKLLKIKSEYTKSFTDMGKKFVGPMVSSLSRDVAGKIPGGLQKKYDQTFNIVLAATKSSSIAKKAATAVQKSFLSPIKKLQDALPCAGENIAESLGGSISDLLSPMIDNVENFVPCVVDQFTGAIFNKIIGGIDKELGPALGGVGALLGGFDPIGSLRGKAEGLLGVQNAVGCIIPKSTSQAANFWQIGKGAKNVPGIAAETIMKVANIAQEAQEASASPKGLLGSLISDVGAFDFMNPNVSTAGFSSVLGECYTGPPLNCKGVKINVFAGDGSGVDARPIIGALVGDTFAEQTGSLIGVKLVDPGRGYTVPPIVEVTDTCNNGYGAVAEAIIDYDPQSPTYQQVTDIVIVSAGENYPVIEEDLDEEYTVDHVVVVESGENYQDTDVITDTEGNVYEKILDDEGRILNVIPPNPNIINVVPVSFVPELQIETLVGRGAIIKPQIAPRPSYQGEIKQVIDCITPRDGIVGYINGDPYYGPFHVHPDRGVKMVGVAHTTTPHAIIYDTPAESRSSTAVRASTTTMTTVASPAAAPYSPTPSPTTTTPSTTPSTSTPPASPPPASSPPASSPPSNPSPPSSPPPSGGGGGYGY